MRRIGWFLFPFILVFLSLVSHAQNWSGIIDPARATDWSGVGVQGGIPTRTTICSTIAPYTGSAATINNAITACPPGQVVFLSAGTFTLNTGVLLSKSNVTVRGAGADQTILNFSGQVGTGCHIGDGRVFNICAGGGNIGVDSTENTATWSAGYSKGTTVITLSTVSNLTVGRTIWLDQLDEGSDGYPAAGDIWTSNWGAGESYTRSSRGTLEGHVVTACGTSVPNAACTSTSVTIEPAIQMPDFRSGQSPGAWWGNASTIITGSGVENLTIDATPAGSNAIYVVNATNCWIKGVRTLRTDLVSSGQPRVVNFINAVHVSVVDNYFYGPQASSLVSNYGIAAGPVSSSLYQNNIIHASVNPFVINTATYGNVFAYNYLNNVGVNPGFSQSSVILHGVASMNLFEGNSYRNFSGDNIHTSHFFNTLFRNNLTGTVDNPSGTETQAAVALYAVQRFFNVIGNVIGATDWSSYTNGQSPPAHCQTCIYELGWEGTNGNAMGATGNDTNVLRTLMRWGNYDNVNGAVRFVNSEVPSGITNYSNPVPASQALPASFYLNSKPAWFGSVPWPPIGPDVTGGNVPTSGGHANKNPARACYEGLTNDPAYPSSSPSIKLFNASTCYGQGGSPTPNPPTNLGTVVK